VVVAEEQDVEPVVVAVLEVLDFLQIHQLILNLDLVIQAHLEMHQRVLQLQQHLFQL
tara:strand:- start:368 stop:538 length:171 start_codon:yes stop_codon:yes gene_type:complete